MCTHRSWTVLLMIFAALLTVAPSAAQAQATQNPLQIGLLKWYAANQVASFSVGAGPFGVAFDGAHIWVSNVLDNSLSKLRASDGGVIATFTLPTFPAGLAFDGANIWIANGNLANTVTKLRATDGTVLGTFPVGTQPIYLAFDGTNIWVSNTVSNDVTKLWQATDL